MNTKGRLDRLEAEAQAQAGDIAPAIIWHKTPDDMDAAFAAAVEQNTVARGDRDRCLFIRWQTSEEGSAAWSPPFAHGRHAQSLPGCAPWMKPNEQG